MKDGRVTFRLEDGRMLDMEAGHPQLTTQKSFYVEISRARDRVELVTNDAKALREQLEAATGERIAALEAIKSDKAKTPEAGSGGGDLPVPRINARGNPPGIAGS